MHFESLLAVRDKYGQGSIGFGDAQRSEQLQATVWTAIPPPSNFGYNARDSFFYPHRITRDILFLEYIHRFPHQIADDLGPIGLHHFAYAPASIDASLRSNLNSAIYMFQAVSSG